MPLGRDRGSRSWLEKGRRIVLKLRLRICTIMARQLRDHKPCGTKAHVSRPNQLTPVRRTSRPAAFSRRVPCVCRYLAGVATETRVARRAGVGTYRAVMHTMIINRRRIRRGPEPGDVS